MTALSATLSSLLVLIPTLGLNAQSPTAPSAIIPPVAAPQQYNIHFPRDLYDHPSYQTEWWYYTGNLKSGKGRQYGFELTFFHTYQPSGAPAGQPQFVPIIFADLAVSDLDGQRFFFHKAVAPQTTPLASITEKPWTIQLGSWTLTEPDTIGGVFHLQAFQDDFGVDLALVPEERPVLHGVKGLFELDAPGQGTELYEYYSIPRLKAQGSIQVNGETIPVEGLAWNDHEFFNLAPGQRFPAWDWFSIQLSEKSSLMLYGVHLPNGQFDPASEGTYISEDGKITHLQKGDYTLTPGATWHSAATNADYPIVWSINIPRLAIELAMTTSLADQEMAGVPGGASPSYWEGASQFRGVKQGKAVEGKGYLEMLGYSKP